MNVIYKFPYRNFKTVTLRLYFSINEEENYAKTKEIICIYTFVKLNITGKLETGNIEMIPESRISGAKHSCKKRFNSSVE
jgi:hypothetical protein